MAPFGNITKPSERRYVLAYWRWALGWQPYPAEPKNLSAGRRVALRQAVRTRMKKYDALVKRSGSAKLLRFPNGGSNERTYA